MSVLKSLKGTIVGVQHDISASLKNLKIKSPDDIQGNLPDSGIELDAGADLLNKFQTQWAELHDLSEGNARAAENVDGMVTDLFLNLEKQNGAGSQFMNELATLPLLTEQLESVVTKLGQISGQCAELDSLMLQLEDTIEANELQMNKRRHEHQLGLYRQKKDLDIEVIKVRLAKQHAEKSVQYEARLQETLMVRQEAFEEAYNEEIQNYKMHGETHFKPSSAVEKQVDLGDITLDDGNDEKLLEDFFSDVGADTEVTTAMAAECLSAGAPISSSASTGSDNIAASNSGVPTAAEVVDDEDEDDEPCTTVNVQVTADKDYSDDEDDESKSESLKP